MRFPYENARADAENAQPKSELALDKFGWFLKFQSHLNDYGARSTPTKNWKSRTFASDLARSEAKNINIAKGTRLKLRQKNRTTMHAFDRPISYQFEMRPRQVSKYVRRDTKDESLNAKVISWMNCGVIFTKLIW